MHGHDDLPTGVVTFLLTDVEDSTGHWRDDPDAGESMRRQREIIRTAVVAHGGVMPVEQGEGDSTVAAFSLPSSAVTAALDAQRELLSEQWTGHEVRVRMAVHTGEAGFLDERTYGGATIIRCARLRELARGAQVLASAATVLLTENDLPPSASFRELGSVTLRGFAPPETVHQLDHPELPSDHANVLGPGSLPSFPTALVGRTSEIADIVSLISGARLVTLTGSAGSGKTRLAEAVATRCADHFDRTVWVDLAPVSDEGRVATAAAGACGLSESTGLNPLTMLRRQFADVATLLVLDNCEHVLSAAAALCDAVLRDRGGTVVLTTTREPLGIAGEIVWRIPSLAVPSDPDDKAAEAADAVRLFVARARDSHPDLVVDATTLPSIVRVCQRLDGIPLALELAAARLRVLSLDEIEERLDERFRLLTSGPRTAMERHKTLQASIDWSFDLLQPDECTLLRRLSVFPGHFGHDTVEGVTPGGPLDRLDVFDVLLRLVDKSLVQRTDRGYRLLESVRQFASQKAMDAGELVDLRDRHAEWFLMLARGWQLDRRPARAELLDEVAAAEDDLRAALNWLLPADPARAAVLLYPLASLMLEQTRYRDNDALARSVCAHVAPDSADWLMLLAPFLPGLVHANSWWWAARAMAALSEHRGDVDASIAGRVEVGLAVPEWFRGESSAVDDLERAVRDARRSHDEALEVQATLWIGTALAPTGHTARVRACVGWLRRHVGHDAAAGLLTDVQEMFVDCFEGALARATASATALLDRPLPTAALQGVMWVAECTASPELLARIEDRAGQQELTGLDAPVSANLAYLRALFDGDLDAAYARVEDIHAAYDYYATGLAWSSSTLAILALARGELERAIEHREHSAQFLASLDAPYVAGFNREISALIAHASDDQLAARQAAHAALELGAVHGLSLLLVTALETLAVISFDSGSVDEGARLIGFASACRRERGIALLTPYLDGQVDRIRQGVAPELLEQGSAMSIEQAVGYAQRLRGERDRPTTGWGSLTKAERRVVDLAAVGRSNRDIAAELFVSVATVKTHLVHVYRKLDLESRAALISAALSRNDDDEHG
jgi:predicted ATPase/DNA-binding CsgD family transcriptional regulator